MAFPQVGSTSSNNSGANATSHSVTLPASIAAGDLLIVAFAHDDAGGSVTSSITSPASGWTALVDELVANSAGTAARLNVFYRIADGAEASTITVTTSGSEGAAWACYRITAASWHGTTVPEATTNNPTSSANPDPPNLDPANWGTEDTLWIVVYGWDGNNSHTSYPTNYGSNQLTQRWANSNGAGIAMASRELNAGSENPGTATISGSDQWAAVTLAVRPQTGTTVTPTTASLTTATFAPTIGHTINGASPTALTLTTYAPTIAHVINAASPTALTLSTFAPTVSATQNQLVTPDVTALTLTTYAPTVTASDHKTVTPDTASLSLSTFAPSVTQGINVVPDTASLSLTTYAPTVAVSDHKTVTPDTATLALSTFAPTVLTPVTITPDVASLTLTTFAPTVTASDHQVVTPTTAELVLTAYAPNVGSPVEVRPDPASLTLEAFAPTIAITQHVTVTPTPASLAMAAFAPDLVITDHKVVTPTTTALSLTAFSPDVIASDHKVVTPSTASLAVASFAPNVRVGSADADGDVVLGMATPSGVTLGRGDLQSPVMERPGVTLRRGSGPSVTVSLDG